MDAYSTHIPILKQLLSDKALDIQDVFEFGTGLYSTKLFSENSSKIVACEMQSEEWYNKIVKQFEGSDNVDIFYMPGPHEAIEYLSKLNSKFDLIFVDGHGDSRWKAINEASKHTNLIVSHDTETPSYNWHLVELDDSWERIDHKEHNPWTTVWRKQ